MSYKREKKACKTCRKRRVKCDTNRPICGACSKGKRPCAWSAPEPHQEIVLPFDETIERSPTGSAVSTSNGEASDQDVQMHDPPAARNQSSQFEPGILLREGEGRSHYYGPTFWANPILTETDDGQSTLLRQTPQWAYGSKSDRSSTDFHSDFFDNSGNCAICGGPFSPECCLSLLPPKQICDNLCNAFFVKVFPLIPIMHVPSFKRDLEQFWTDLHPHGKHRFTIGNFLRERPDFLSLLAAIMFAGVSTLSDSEAKILVAGKLRDTAEVLRFVAVKSAHLVGFPNRPTLSTLSAYIITEMQLLREEDFPNLNQMVGLAPRLARMMGLHLNSSQYTFPEAEIRKRIWRYIIHLDAMMSASSGIDMHIYDTTGTVANFPSICRSDHHERDANLSITDLDVRYIVARSRYDISNNLRSIMHKHFSKELASIAEILSTTRVLSDLATSIFEINSRLLPDSLQSSVSAVPASLSASQSTRRLSQVLICKWALSGRSTDCMTDAFCSWAAILLHLMVHKAYCVLYHPFMRKSPGTIPPAIRTSAIMHAQAFMLLFITFCIDSRTSHYRWMYPGIYQPLQPMAVLLADLVRRPHSDDAAVSRGLIDAAFELYQADNGIVNRNEPALRALSESGKISWRMLIQERTKALEAANHDPHVLLPFRPLPDEPCICTNPIRVKRGATQRRASIHSTVFEPHRHIDANDLTTAEILGEEPDDYAYDALMRSAAGFLP